MDEREATRPPVSEAAMTSVIIGVAGVAYAATSAPLPLLPPIVALVVAARARMSIRRSRGRKRGLGLAQKGWWLGVAGIFTRIVVAMIVEARSPWLLAFVAIPIVAGGFFSLVGRSEERRRVH